MNKTAKKRPSRIHLASVLATVLLWAALGMGCAQRVAVRELPALLPDPAAEISRARELGDRIAAGRDTEKDRKAYNESVRKIVHHLEPSGSDFALDSSPVSLDNRLRGLTKLPDSTRLIPADSLLIHGFRERIVVDGVGTPVVLHFPPEGYSTEAGIWQPATAVLEFDGANAPPRLVLHDTLAYSDAPVMGSPPQSLRADHTAPLAAGFASQNNQWINIPAMLHFEKYADKLGLNQIDLIHPGKIPVVFIHGLKSSPITWRDTMNELRADPAVRERYEFWTFGYGTGAPIPFSAMELREAIQGMVTYREHLGAKTDDVILIGHSMGGLLSRLMTERSGDDIWFEFFTKPVDQLPIPQDERDLMKAMVYYEPLPYVREVVFLSTPHGGSQLADDPIGRAFSDLIQLPKQLLFLSSSMVRIPFQLLTPEGRKLLGNIPTSIDQLESNSDMLLRLKAMPLNPKVSFHSIIGNRGKDGPIEDSTDGVVPYRSSHIEGTASEKIISAYHFSQTDPDAIAEIQRILREHTDG